MAMAAEKSASAVKRQGGGSRFWISQLAVRAMGMLTRKDHTPSSSKCRSSSQPMRCQLPEQRAMNRGLK